MWRVASSIPRGRGRNLRARHRWPAARARRLLFAALLDGVLR
jgi:hypothetical protein